MKRRGAGASGSLRSVVSLRTGPETGLPARMVLSQTRGPYLQGELRSVHQLLPVRSPSSKIRVVFMAVVWGPGAAFLPGGLHRGKTSPWVSEDTCWQDSALLPPRQQPAWVRSQGSWPQGSRAVLGICLETDRRPRSEPPEQRSELGPHHLENLVPVCAQGLTPLECVRDTRGGVGGVGVSPASLCFASFVIHLTFAS